MDVPPGTGKVEGVLVTGVFALHAGADHEPVGTLGATLELWDDDKHLHRWELVHGRHYSEALGDNPLKTLPGDGTSLETIGCTEIAGHRYRVDQLRLEVETPVSPTWIKFRDQGSPASFVVFDVALVSRPQHKCPFHPDSNGVPLSEIPAIVRVGDRVRMQVALQQLRTGILAMTDLDEARGEALTFLAVVTSSALENGGPRDLHRLQLEAARQYDTVASVEEIARAALEHVSRAAPALFQPAKGHNSALIDKALCLVNRYSSRPLRDSDVAVHIGLSTSHFRHLFREATGQPFHKYLLAIRLEKARAMICQDGATVTEAAKAAGFKDLSHFSRAFTERFAVRPSDLRGNGAGS